MTELKISLEAATEEWIAFLKDNDASTLIPDESMKTSEDKKERDDYATTKANFEKIINAIAKGLVTIEDGVITQKLQFPLKTASGDIIAEELVYNQRWTAKDRQEIYKGLDPSKFNEAMQIQQKLCSKLTGQQFMVLGNLDSKDQKITDQIVAVFFM